MSAPKIVLASTSRYRAELLARLQLPFEALAPAYEERPLALPPEALVAAHARGKALSLADVRPDALILGSDQAVAIDGEVLGKPLTEERAVRQLLRLAGREHRLLTAVALHEPRTGRTEEALDLHRVRLRPLTEAEAADYVARDRPLDCAGSYRVESLGIALIDSLAGEDFTAVIGLPLVRTVALLARFGVRVLGR